MIMMLIYVAGALSLHFTNLASGDFFTSFLLPSLNVLFFVFLLAQLIFYFSLGGLSDDNDTDFYDLLYKIFHLDIEIRRQGVLPAIFDTSLLLIDALSLFTVVFYYLSAFLDFVTAG